jgi:hypothetical protein
VWKRGECYVQKILKVNKTVVDYRRWPLNFKAKNYKSYCRNI